MQSNLKTPDNDEVRRRFEIAGMPLTAIAFLVLSAAIAFIHSHYRILEGDELGFGLLDICRGFRFSQFVHIQLTRPVSFDPMGYNALIYGVIQNFGTGALAMRLLPISGYLLMQACLFWMVRRIANDWAATVALALPALLGAGAIYSIVERPYGLLLGLAAVAMLCWQIASRREAKRGLALVGLALSLAAAVNVQYYAVLLFVPICAAEAVRTMEAKRIDLPMVGSIAGGFAGLILAVPFAKVLSRFQANHRPMGLGEIHFVTHSYMWLAIGYSQLSVPQMHVLGLCGGLLLLAILVGFIRVRRTLALRLPLAEAVLLLVLAAMPISAFLLAFLVTHFVEARYILPAMIGVCGVIAILLTPLSRNRVAAGAVLTVLAVAIVAMGFERVQADRTMMQERRASLDIAPETQQALDKYPGQPVYVVNPSVWNFVDYYSPSKDLRSRFTLLYIDPRDARSQGVGADTNEQVANMEADGVPLVASYEEVAIRGSEHLFLLYHPLADSIEHRLMTEHAEIQPLGPLLGGELVMARFP
jgi:hypothetical protein